MELMCRAQKANDSLQAFVMLGREISAAYIPKRKPPVNRQR